MSDPVFVQNSVWKIVAKPYTRTIPCYPYMEESEMAENIKDDQDEDGYGYPAYLKQIKMLTRVSQHSAYNKEQKRMELPSKTENWLLVKSNCSGQVRVIKPYTEDQFLISVSRDKMEEDTVFIKRKDLVSLIS